MRLHALLIVGVALVVTSCVEKKEAAPAQGDDSPVAAGSAVVELPAAEAAGMGSDAFIRHMHLHASHLDRLNAALAAGDLEAAQTPAYWLLRHEGVSGHPGDWDRHIKGIRDAARAVTDAPDLGAARAAAQHITDGCRGCHTAAGVDIQL
ncbi:MAG: hypothetical protein OER97_04510 [Gammaproteobacteria bacterium]|nr:hypothetical protein [Gammaproteobacteria bacterium]